MERQQKLQIEKDQVQRRDANRLHNVALLGLKHISVDKLLAFIQRRSQRRISRDGR